MIDLRSRFAELGHKNATPIRSTRVQILETQSTHLYGSQDDARSDRSNASDEERDGDLDRRLPPFFRLDAGELVLLALVVPAPVTARGIAAHARL